MIEISYRRLGLIKIKLTYFADYLPALNGYNIIFSKCCYKELAYVEPYDREERETLLFDLTQDTEALFGKVQKDRRRLIRMGQKNDIKVRTEKPTIEVLREFIQMYEGFMPAKGGEPIHGIDTLKLLIPYLTVLRGEYEGQTLEMMLCLNDGATARAMLMAFAEPHPKIEIKQSLGSFFHWQTMLHFKQLGYQVYDFGGIIQDRNSNFWKITKYKMTFGGTPTPVYYYTTMAPPGLRALLRNKEKIVKTLAKLKSLVNIASQCCHKTILAENA